MAASRQRGGGSPRIDWAAALAFYLGLGPERSYPQVSEKFVVSVTSVGKHARRDNWAEKAAEVDRKAAERAIEKVIRSREQRVEAALRAVDLVVDRGTEELEEGRPDGVYARIPEFVKLAELLSGEATDRVSYDEMQTALRISIGLAVEVAQTVAVELLDGKAPKFVKAYRERYLAQVNAELGAEA